MLFVVYYLLCVVFCGICVFAFVYAVSCLSFNDVVWFNFGSCVVCCLVVPCWLVVRCVLLAVCCLLIDVCCLLIVVCCLLSFVVLSVVVC